MKKTWILVADGERAKILQKTKEGLVHVEPNHHSAEVVTEKDRSHHKPGAATFAPLTGKHNFPAHEGYWVFEKEQFARLICDVLDQAQDLFDELILVASPQVLGLLRVHLSKKCLQKVTHEIDKDYTRTPLEDLESLI